MSRTYVTEQQKNLNGSVVAVLFVALILLAGQQRYSQRYLTGFCVLLGIVVAWMLFEWVMWYRSRATKSAPSAFTIRQVIQKSIANWQDSYVVLGVFLFIPVFSMMGGLLDQLPGALIGLTCGVLNVLHAVIVQKYPP